MSTSSAPANAAAAAGGIEENAMAILDSSGIKDSRDLHDDRATFLEAVRSACLATDNPTPPSWRMYNAVFQILQHSSSLELAMASFHLLMDLGKQYPRAYLADSGKAGTLVVVKESWSPFLLGSDAACGDTGANARSLRHLFDSSRFSTLIKDMVEAANDADVNHGIKENCSVIRGQMLTLISSFLDSMPLPIENMLLFQYLVNTLDTDFVPRHVAYKESSDWVIFRESLLNMLLVSRKLVFKALVKNCISLVLDQYHNEVEDTIENSISSKEDSAKSAYGLDSSQAFSVCEIERGTLVSVQKLFVLVMELDLIRKEADALGLTSRADGFRSPILEVILDELTYNAFTEPKWKLEIALQYFSKYCSKSAVRTRRSDSSPEDLTLESVLSFFSTPTSTKAIVKKMTTEVAQLLLAHAYQVCLSLQCHSSQMDRTKKIGETLLQISYNFISAFQNLRKINQDVQISSFEKEALFTAAALVTKLKNEER